MSAQALPNNPPGQKPPNTGVQLAELLLRAEKIDAKVLDRALRVFSKLDTENTLFSVLKKMGLTDEKSMLSIIRRWQPEIRIGELLVELGYINASQLRQALLAQAKEEEPIKLGEILLSRRMIKPVDLTRVLASQLGYLSEETEIGQCEDELLSMVATKLAKRFNFLPIRRNGKNVVVALTDPNDQEARTEAARALGAPIEPLMISFSALQRALSALERQRKSKNEDETKGSDTSTASGKINVILSEAIREGASDIHIEPLRDHVRVRFRIDGILREHSEFGHGELDAIVSRAKIMAEADISERRRHQDGRIEFEDPFSGSMSDLRVSFYVTVHGECIVIRILNQNDKILELPEIGMAPNMLDRFKHHALEAPSGVIIITGPTGSGKTSTLYSCIQHLNNDSTSIITAEDPVEYQVDGVSQCSVNHKLGRTFEGSLRAIVRQDPDIIVLGEIRDETSAESAIQAALTGHKVLTTFHTEDSIGGLLRLLNMNIEAFLISSTVVCVVAQRLIRRVCTNCSKDVEADAQDLQLLAWDKVSADMSRFKEGEGCDKCHFTGYRGRVAVFEALLLTEPVREAILQRKTSAQIRKISLEYSGMVTLLEDGLAKAACGETTLREVRRTLPRLSKPRSLAEIRRLNGKNA
ncbi:MAG: ATPase, T2SS/T4P/T4SS family [Granulosicoccaceae bacterium]